MVDNMYQLPEARSGMMDPTEAGVLGLPPGEQELAVALLEKVPHLVDLYSVRDELLDELVQRYQIDAQSIYFDSPGGVPSHAVRSMVGPVLRDLQQQVIRLLAQDLLDRPV